MTDAGSLRRLTRCTVPGHGTRCEVAAEKPDRWTRSREKVLVLEYEQNANGEEER